MNKLICTAALAMAITTGALAQSEPVKSTAMVKHAHTVNDGGAEAGRNSFTQEQAREHIANSGFTAVSPLTKGDDGVWRGSARKQGHIVNVALDFKGNISATSR